MLRIFFTSDDIARTRLAAAPDPLWETVLSMHALRNQKDGSLAVWRRTVTDELRAAGPTLGVRTLFALNPPTGYFPDFLTPFPAAGLEAGLASLSGTPTTLIRRDLEILSEHRQVPSPARELVSPRDGAEAMRRLADLAVDP